MNDESLAEWLRLREPADRSARSEGLAGLVARHLPQDGPVHIVDLGSGAGSNVRYLVERLPGVQRWLVADRSSALLSRGLDTTADWAIARGYHVHRDGSGIQMQGARLDCRVEPLARDLRELASDIFVGRHLVTASALLDLVSKRWLETLAAHCRTVGAVALMALTYDGRSGCAPAEPEDELVRGLLNAHQHSDKGLGGVAEGPEAARSAGRFFGDAGYRVEGAITDWTLGGNDAAMQRVLIDGWTRAACELAPEARPLIADWQARRLAHVDAGRSHIVVGHRDFAAVPRG